MNKKIIITGINGFTGQQAKSYFESCGYDIYGVTRKKSQMNENKYQCELTDFTQVRALINAIKPDYILHLAAQNNVETSWATPLETIETNVLSTLYLLESIRLANLQTKVLITTSSLQYNFSAHSPMNHPYGLSKTLQSSVSTAWQQMYNQHIILAKPSNLIGPGISKGVCSFIAKKIVEFEHTKTETPTINVTNKLASRNFIDVRDSVRAYETLLQHGTAGTEYEISSPVFETIEKILQYYQSLTSVPFLISSLKDESEKYPLPSIEPILQLGWKPHYHLYDSLQDILEYERTIIQ